MNKNIIEFTVIDGAEGKDDKHRIDNLYEAISRLKIDLTYILTELEKRISKLGG